MCRLGVTHRITCSIYCLGGLEQWMSGMGETLNEQDLIAARVKLVEGQIEGFKVTYIKLLSYSTREQNLIIRTQCTYIQTCMLPHIKHIPMARC